MKENEPFVSHEMSNSQKRVAHGKFCWAIFNSMPAGSHETGWRARFNFDVIISNCAASYGVNFDVIVGNVFIVFMFSV